MLYLILADALVILHAGIVLFIGGGLLLILTGAWRHWQWIRNVWFRMLHAGAIVCVVAESWLGIPCPLTVWEQQLRRKGGEGAYEGDFIAHGVNELLYYDLPDWAFTVFYTCFAAAVLYTLYRVPPHWSGRKKQPEDKE